MREPKKKLSQLKGLIYSVCRRAWPHVYVEHDQEDSKLKETYDASTHPLIEVLNPSIGAEMPRNRILEG